jgi:hypothetical protein
MLRLHRRPALGLTSPQGTGRLHPVASTNQRAGSKPIAQDQLDDQPGTGSERGRLRINTHFIEVAALGGPTENGTGVVSCSPKIEGILRVVTVAVATAIRES